MMTTEQKALRAERDALESAMVALYGYESPITIQFFQMTAQWDLTEWNNKALSILVQCHQAQPIEEEDLYADDDFTDDDADLEMGFDPYEGCYSYDC